MCTNTFVCLNFRLPIFYLFKFLLVSLYISFYSRFVCWSVYLFFDHIFVYLSISLCLLLYLCVYRSVSLPLDLTLCLSLFVCPFFSCFCSMPVALLLSLSISSPFYLLSHLFPYLSTFLPTPLPLSPSSFLFFLFAKIFKNFLQLCDLMTNEVN